MAPMAALLFGVLSKSQSFLPSSFENRQPEPKKRDATARFSAVPHPMYAPPSVQRESRAWATSGSRASSATSSRG